MKPVNVLLLIRNEIQREGLRRLLLDQSLAIIGCYADYTSFDLEFAVEGADNPPVVLIDLSTMQENLDACRHLRADWPQCKIVIFAAKCDGQTVAEAFLAGSDGYVAKHTSVSSLGNKLMLVALGEKIIPADVFLELSTQWTENPALFGSSNLSDVNLSERELQILERLVHGDANKVISRGMAITEATVKVHVKAILRKLSVANRTQAAIWGVSRGIGKGVITADSAMPLSNLSTPAHAHPGNHIF